MALWRRRATGRGRSRGRTGRRAPPGRISSTWRRTKAEGSATWCRTYREIEASNGPSGRRVEERLPLEPGPVAEPGAAGPGPGDHLVGEVDADHPMAGLQEGQADQPGPATGVEDQGVGRQVGLADQPGQRRRVGLDRGLLEPGGLAVEGRRRGPDRAADSRVASWDRFDLPGVRGGSESPADGSAAIGRRVRSEARRARQPAVDSGRPKNFGIPLASIRRAVVVSRSPIARPNVSDHDRV